MNGQNDSNDLARQLNLWVPRILIAISILLLVYFTERTHRFTGLFDDTFLAEDNLELSRGPFAKKEFYERGEVDYQGKPMFEEESGENPIDLSQFGLSSEPDNGEATPEEQQ